jgi:hypothetical protein
MSKVRLPDPGGVFLSDEHRRVLAHLPVPEADEGISLDELIARMGPDRQTAFTDSELLHEVVQDLVDEGDAKGTTHFKMTKGGFERLTGPALTMIDEEGERVEPPPLEGEALVAAEKANREWHAANKERAKRDEA